MPHKLHRVGDWQLIRQLGQGGFGEVQQWKNIVTNQEIATKHIKNDTNIGADQERKLKERWIKEYNWTRQFQNLTFIVAGVQLGDESAEFIKQLNDNHIWQLPVIILEYCNGGDVRKLLQQAPNVNGLVQSEVCNILSCLRQSVVFLHNTCGICHRDLKPDNIVIHRLPNSRKLYKLTDFGLARNMPAETMLQSVVGTRHYFAPEVVDSGKYNNSVDFWSMGIIGYEIATGVLPFIPHQKPFNIHFNLCKKPRNCIAITEDVEEEERFHFHTELAVKHHLSSHFVAKLKEFLSLALDSDYSRRGIQGATDGVQGPSRSPIIFTKIDDLLGLKVLTLFVAFKYQRLEYVVTPTMAMSELALKIAKDTDMKVDSLYLMLPTGHPHGRVTRVTQPIDLYVDEWCDTSEASKGPPVMVYIFNMKHCDYSAPPCCMTDLVQNCIGSQKKWPPWVMDRMVLDIHYILSKEHATMRTMLFGFKEHAMSLEHDMLIYQSVIKTVNIEKEQCCGAMSHFDALISAAKQQNKLNMANKEEFETNVQRLANLSNEIISLIEQTIHHYDSSLGIIRDVAIKQSADIYKSFMDADTYKLSRFRKLYITHGDKLSCSDAYNIVINLAKERHSLLMDEKLKFLRESLNQALNRFAIIPNTLQTACQRLKDIRMQLLQLNLQMLPAATSNEPPSMLQLSNAISQLHFDTVNEVPSADLDTFDSLNTRSIIDQALQTSLLLENAMETEQ
ncbi:inhibitor of nuclear factor kappa-B kinase subunit beta [Drosophila nasuta]|uniref:inhibitor of nuclear factor kappa-B kinase subunit beta n=1 Tax=Drosophila nasuta TaxID=42062 RepID=UPI00295E666C|nr:inhibitor of nuclear factor kappa-B kinase subunit beta [Drosophila nasuta]